MTHANLQRFMANVIGLFCDRNVHFSRLKLANRARSFDIDYKCPWVLLFSIKTVRLDNSSVIGILQ